MCRYWSECLKYDGSEHEAFSCVSVMIWRCFSCRCGDRHLGVTGAILTKNAVPLLRVHTQFRTDQTLNSHSISIIDEEEGLCKGVNGLESPIVLDDGVVEGWKLVKESKEESAEEKAAAESSDRLGKICPEFENEGQLDNEKDIRFYSQTTRLVISKQLTDTYALINARAVQQPSNFLQ